MTNLQHPDRPGPGPGQRLFYRALLYRVLLYLYPKSHRTRFGPEMIQAFLEAQADSSGGVIGRLRLWSREFSGALRWGLGERLAELRSGPGRRGSGSDPNRNHTPNSIDPEEGIPLMLRMDQIVQDLRYAARSLFRNPGLTALAVISIGIGVGANTSMFSTVNNLLWSTLPVPEPGQLARVYQSGNGFGSMSYPNFVDIMDQAETLEGGLVHFTQSFALVSDERTDVIHGEAVSANYFQVLGLAPAAGRFFDPNTAEAPESPVEVVISHHLWESWFGSDPAVVGRTVTVSGVNVSVVGVGPAAFSGTKFGIGMDLWVPIRPWNFSKGLTDPIGTRGSRSLDMIVRLEPGSDLNSVNRELSVIASRLGATYPASNRNTTFLAMPERTIDPNAGSVPKIISGFALGVSALVLLVACGNVASLLLARSVGRAKEIGVRVAMGADRNRLVRFLLTESALLAVMGGIAGLAAAFWVPRAIMLFLPTLPFRFDFDLSPDGTTLVFAGGVTLLATLVFGLMPALQASRTEVATTLRRETGGSGGGVRRGRLLGGIVVGMMAMSFATLVLASLFMKSLSNVQAMDAGFRTEGGVIGIVDLSLAGYSGGDPTRQFYGQLLDRIRPLPGVRQVALGSGFPLIGFSSSTNMFAADRTYSADDLGVSAWQASVTPGYFEALGQPILHGRDFDEADTRDAPFRVIINETLAGQFWPGEDPVGKLIRTSPTSSGNDIEVIGVVPNAKYRNVVERPTAAMYLPYGQNAPTRAVLVISGEADPAAVVQHIREELRALDPNVPLYGIQTLTAHKTGSLWLFRMGAGVGWALGLTALILAASGLFGVISFMVRQRRQEVGIRMALGANRRDITAEVLSRSVKLTLLGISIGLGLAILSAGLVRSLLIGVSPVNPEVLLAVAAGLALVALVAALIPALFASRADPVSALRAE